MNNIFINEAIKESIISYKLDEIPVGAVITKNNIVIAKGHNLKHNTNKATNHAEIISINNACTFLKSWCLNECSLYVTLEPCIMCAGAILESRIKNLYIGTANPYNGFFSTNYYREFPNLNIYWYNNTTCEKLINRFFQKKRIGL